MNLLKKYKLTNNKKYANLWPRFLANCIDKAIFNLACVLSFYLLVQQTSWEKMLGMVAVLLALVVFPIAIFSLIYYPLFLSKWGKTIGKAVLGIKVVGQTGKLLSFKQAIFREFVCKGVSAVALGVGFFAILFDKNHQAWHDKLAGSYVEVENKNILAGTITLGLLIAVHAYFIWEIISRILSLLGR